MTEIKKKIKTFLELDENEITAYLCMGHNGGSFVEKPGLPGTGTNGWLSLQRQELGSKNVPGIQMEKSAGLYSLPQASDNSRSWNSETRLLDV